MKGLDFSAFGGRITQELQNASAAFTKSETELKDYKKQLEETAKTMKATFAITSKGSGIDSGVSKQIERFITDTNGLINISNNYSDMMDEIVSKK